VKNPDILKDVGALKNKPLTIGFAAETQDLIKHANQKLQQKNADMIIANQITDENSPFASDYNEVTILQPKQDPIHLPRDTKINLAQKIVELILSYEHME